MGVTSRVILTGYRVTGMMSYFESVVFLILYAYHACSVHTPVREIHKISGCAEIDLKQQKSLLILLNAAQGEPHRPQ